MIDCLFWLDFFLPTYSNSLRFPYFMKLAHRHFFENVVIFFAVLFSFQRTIALSDLINIAYSLSSVKLFFQSSKANALCIISVCFPFVKHFFLLIFLLISILFTAHTAISISLFLYNYILYVVPFLFLCYS